MSIPRATSAAETLAKILFLALPTALLGHFLLLETHRYFTVVQTERVLALPALTLEQSASFAVGMLASVLFYAIRFRFIPTAALLFIALWAGYKGLDALAVGEFDLFFISIRFLTFALLFGIGWLVGWAFQRVRYAAVGVAGTALALAVVLVAKSKLDTVPALLWRFVPVALFSVFIIYAAEQIYNYRDRSRSFWGYLGLRLAGFTALAAVALGGVVLANKKRIEETVAQWGGGGKAGESSMLKGNKDGTFDLKKYNRLQSSLSRNNELLFAARIDNFFPESTQPNPLYLTAFYYTKFDTLTETFLRDSVIPDNDLFEPAPGTLPLFSTQTDSSVLRSGLRDKLKKVVEIEVYNRRLSPNTYLAPHTGFFVQPVTVDKDYRDQFKAAFRAKSLVSELNSAYFIYNADDPTIQAFQQQRFEVLRRVPGYTGVDARFMRYYTYMPSDPKWGGITALAREVTAGKTLPVDKVLAIRDWFLSTDPATGQPRFKYTDNPGIPDLPSASKLMYFLFENRKGYCAYYAGATLFMLRALGIPSRIAVGFLTVDRSGGKNPGWYWYYADQAHAWVQVYFPGYGWLDFDTTVGNTDAEQSPQPDGTPPTQPGRALLAATGVVTDVDTLRKTLSLQVRSMVYRDAEYKLSPTVQKVLDVRIAAIRRDSVDVPLASVRRGDSATAVSYAEVFKSISAKPGESGAALLARLPSPAPVDEVYIRRPVAARRDTPPQVAAAPEPFNWVRAGWITGGVLALLGLLYLLIPAVVLAFLGSRARGAATPERQAYWSYRTAEAYLHQLGVYRGGRTPLRFAADVVDPQYGTNYARFVAVYLKTKYAGAALTPAESSEVRAFLPAFLDNVRSRYTARQRAAAFLRPARTLRRLLG